MNNLPWNERVNAISINPDMANRRDIAKMAADLSDLESALAAKDAELAETRRMLDIVIERGVEVFNCLICEDAKKAHRKCTDKRCARNIRSWALAEVRKEQEEAISNGTIVRTVCGKGIVIDHEKYEERTRYRVKLDDTSNQSDFLKILTNSGIWFNSNEVWEEAKNE